MDEPTLEIFRTGTHTSANGATIGFDRTHLQEIADNYRPDHHEAPVVVGHPQDNTPAYGWIKGLKVAGDRLLATLHQLNPDFVKLIKQKSYKKVSASLYPPESMANPTPGKWALRHLGFLGAIPPAVKGLAPIDLAEIETLEFATSSAQLDFYAAADRTIYNLLQRLREWLIDTYDLEIADRVFPGEMLGILQSELFEPDYELVDFRHRIEALDQDLKKTQLNLDQLQNRLESALTAIPRYTETETAMDNSLPPDFAEREQQLTQREQALRRAEFTQFCEPLYTKGTFFPGLIQQDDLIAFMEYLASAPEPVNFSEGPRSPLDFFQSLLKTLSKQLPVGVPFGEVGSESPRSGGEDLDAAYAASAEAYETAWRQK